MKCLYKVSCVVVVVFHLYSDAQKEVPNKIIVKNETNFAIELTYDKMLETRKFGSAVQKAYFKIYPHNQAELGDASKVKINRAKVVRTKKDRFALFLPVIDIKMLDQALGKIIRFRNSKIMLRFTSDADGKTIFVEATTKAKHKPYTELLPTIID